MSEVGNIVVTERAVEEIKRVMAEQSFTPEEYVLEAGVAAGGCSGYQYKLNFKKKTEIDRLNTATFKFLDLEAVVDNRSMMFMDGTTIDFHDGLEERGFVFSNPQSTKSCGCGKSFNA